MGTYLLRLFDILLKYATFTADSLTFTEAHMPLLTKHAAVRLGQRTKLTKEEVHKVLSSNAFVPLAEESGSLVSHKLIYSKPDDNCFVVIQSVRGSIITIIPWWYYSRTIPIPKDTLRLAREIYEVKHPKPRPKWVKRSRWSKPWVRRRRSQQQKAQVIPRGMTNFFGVLMSPAGQTRFVNVGKFEPWDTSDAAKNKKVLNFIRVGIRQVQEPDEVCIALHYQPPSGETRELEIDPSHLNSK